MKPTSAWISVSLRRSPQAGIAVPGTPIVMICCSAASVVAVKTLLTFRAGARGVPWPSGPWQVVQEPA